MQAAVYRGQDDVRVEAVPIPSLEAGEVLVRVGACGVCGTDVKKVKLGLLEPPRIFGHETAGTIAAVGDGVADWQVGDRVVVYHHVPDPSSWWSQRGLYAQDELYKKTGTTAGFEPAGGGFAEYVRVLPWIVKRGGLVRVPDEISLDEASFVEPVNTCLKAVRALDAGSDETVLVAGAGSIGLLLMQLLRRDGVQVIVSDPIEGRRTRAEQLGADLTVDPTGTDLESICGFLTQGRGADHAVVAAPGAAPIQEAIRVTRPGARILLFASTFRGDGVEVDVGELCMSEKTLLGSYSASIDLAEEAAQVVFGRQIDLLPLISHRFGLADAQTAIETAATPAADVCKVLVRPETE